MSRRTKHIIAVFALVIVIALAAFALWPRTLEQALGGRFNWAETTEVIVDLNSLNHDEGNMTLIFTPDEERCEGLVDLLTSRRYIPIYLNDNTREITLDYTMHITFSQPDATYCLDMSGADVIWFSGSDVRDHSYRTAGGEAFQREILDYLLGLS